MVSGNDYSPKFDKARSIRLDSLSFNADGTIKKVIPTLRGAGITAASTQIQIDRFHRSVKKVHQLHFLILSIDSKDGKQSLHLQAHGCSIIVLILERRH